MLARRGTVAARTGLVAIRRRGTVVAALLSARLLGLVRTAWVSATVLLVWWGATSVVLLVRRGGVGRRGRAAEVLLLVLLMLVLLLMLLLLMLLLLLRRVVRCVAVAAVVLRWGRAAVLRLPAVGRCLLVGRVRGGAVSGRAVSAVGTTTV